MNIFFTSDHHFSHTNIIKYCARPYATVQEMDADMIDKWNSVVGDRDEVYHLGDFTLGNWGTAHSYLKKLKGRICFIQGNHDGAWWSALENRQKLPPIFELTVNKQKIVLSHYPLRSWNKSFNGSWHLFGHEHGNLPPMGKSFDVGVDTHNLYPYSLDEVFDKMKVLGT